jgi:tetratricopeptide (TPR) repeat protein
MVRHLSVRIATLIGMFGLVTFTAAVWAQAQPASTPTQKSASENSGGLPQTGQAQPGQTQENSPTNSPQNNSSTPNTSTSGTGTTPKPRAPEFSPPRSDRVNVNDLGNDVGESSSKDSPVDLSPPSDDVKMHPKSSEAMTDAEMELTGGVAEFHSWDPHKAAKNVEVGDFYFKRKNYRAAEDRYREALMYKDNDAIATLRLAVCLDKMERPGEALLEYESYLKILPHGPESEQARKAIDRLSQPATSAKKSK